MPLYKIIIFATIISTFVSLFTMFIIQGIIKMSLYKTIIFATVISTIVSLFTMFIIQNNNNANWEHNGDFILKNGQKIEVICPTKKYSKFLDNLYLNKSCKIKHSK
tara:strand:- start:55 stop:372 length:318 start_codon:yes stop_codon:yes gene_type:complete